ncbi:MAG: lytic transglycosylase domain-containing protein [Gemmatimonadaceae bacterium]
MRELRGTYVHRGAPRRRLGRVKQGLVTVGFLVAATFVVLKVRGPEGAVAEVAAAGVAVAAPEVSFQFGPDKSADELQNELDAARGELDLARAQMERMKRIIQYSSRYQIGADLAGSIVDIALAEGIDPELAFRLVQRESDFNPRATSPVGAIGLTQLMPSTARYFVKGITRERLYEPTINLRIGFRYLRGLIAEHRGNVKLALLVYNRGPVSVSAALAEGRDPSNGYDRYVTRGYKGKGVVD